MRDRERAVQAIEDFLRAIGQPSEGELVGTGRRVADAFLDDFLPEGPEPVAALSEARIGAGENVGPVLLRDLAVATMCPHHLLPAHGTATVGYFPAAHIAGLGAVAEVVLRLSRRLVLQETLGSDIAQALQAGLAAHGAFCKLVMFHTCFSTRGERQVNARIETVSFSSHLSEQQRQAALMLLAASPTSQA